MKTDINEYGVYAYIEDNIHRYAGDIKAFYDNRPWGLEYLSYEEFCYYVEDVMRGV